jgi:hypothetical protein
MRDGTAAHVDDMWEYSGWPEEGTDHLVPEWDDGTRLSGLAPGEIDFIIDVEFPYPDLAHIRNALGLS